MALAAVGEGVQERALAPGRCPPAVSTLPPDAPHLHIPTPTVQRDLTKRMLVQACGKSSLAALADWRPPSATPLAEPKQRTQRGQGSGADHQSEAFSAAVVSSLFDN